MGRLNRDVLSLILSRVSDDKDRNNCSLVSKLWYATESETHVRVSIRYSQHIPNFLSRFPNVTDLTLRHRITDHFLFLIAAGSCPRLHSLRLDGHPGHVTDAGIVAVTKACRLSVLHLPSRARLITDRSFAAIAEIPSLTELKFHDCRCLTDAGLISLAMGPASRSLRVLRLSSCHGITDAGVSSLARMSSLEVLSLTYIGRTRDELTDVSGVALGDVSTLRELDLTGNNLFSDRTMFALAKGCRNLQKICLNSCIGIRGEGLLTLASSSLPLKLMKLKNIVGHAVSSSYVSQIQERRPSLKLLY